MKNSTPSSKVGGKRPFDSALVWLLCIWYTWIRAAEHPRALLLPKLLFVLYSTNNINNTNSTFPLTYMIKGAG